MTSTSPRADTDSPRESAPAVEETAFPKETWISVAGRGDWSDVSSAVMAGALYPLKGTVISISDVKAAIKRFQRGE